jgi:phosphonate transport system ATP-binding protein
VAAVQGQGVRVHYGPVRALDGVDFEVHAGEVVALLGHSGSGKSTLMKALTQMAPATADLLRIGDTDVLAQRGKDLRALRSRVGNIFQHFNLVPNVSALTNVLTGGLHRAGPINHLGLFRRQQRERALTLLEWVGLQDQARQQTRTLSGGQQQRVAIARALMQEPEVILADEPVASLDPRLAGSVLSLLRRIAEERHIPVVVSLHVVELAQRYADRVIGLHSGVVVHESPARDLDREAVARIYGEGGEYGDTSDT